MKTFWILLTATFALHLTVHAQTAIDTYEFKLEDVKSLNVQNSVGKVDIAASLNGKAGVAINKTRWGQRCTAKVVLNNGELVVTSNDQNWLVDSECRADFIISVPEEVRSTIRVDLGNVSVTGIKGSLDVRIGSGSAKIHGNFQDVKTWTNQGGIEFKGTGNTMTFRSAEGKIEVAYSQPPKAASLLTVNMGRGDVEVSLPENAEIYTETMTGNGLIRNDFDQDRREHNLKIQAYARAGDVLILKK